MKSSSWLILLVSAGLTACGSPSAPHGSTAEGSPAQVLNEKVAALARSQLDECMSNEFEALRRLSPCKTGDITLAQLANNTKISQADRGVFIKASDRLDGYGKQITQIYQQSDLASAQRIAEARTWAQLEATQNRLALVNHKITWGEYLRQRMSIEAEMLRRAK